MRKSEAVFDRLVCAGAGSAAPLVSTHGTAAQKAPPTLTPLVESVMMRSAA